MNKEITIKIKPPITERCTKCDYEAHYAFNARRCDCPKCGEKGSVNGVLFAKASAVFVYKFVGAFSDNITSFQFGNVPDKFRGLSFEIPNDYACDIDASDPVECAKGVYDYMIKTYMIEGKRSKLESLLKYLESVEGEQWKLRIKEKREQLEFDLYKLISENEDVFEGVDNG